MATRRAADADDLSVCGDSAQGVPGGFAALADATGLPCLLADAAGRALWVNAAWPRAADGAPAALGASDRAAFRRAAAAGGAFRVTLRLLGAATEFHARAIGDGRFACVAAWHALERVAEARDVDARDRAFLLALGDRIRVEGDPQAILAAVSEGVGLHLGVDRVVYAEVDAHAGRMMVCRDWRPGAPGVPAHELPLALFGKGVLAAHRRGETLAVADTRADRRVAAGLADALASIGMRAFLSVPLVKDGRLVAIVAVQQRRVRGWTPMEARLLDEVAERTWSVLERARAQERLRAAERRNAFLLALSDRLHAADGAADMLRIAAAALGEEYRARYVLFSSIEDDDQHLLIEHGWSPPGVPPRDGRWPLNLMGEAIVAQYRRGEPKLVADVAAQAGDAAFPDELAESFRRLGVGAYATVPVLRGGRLSAVLSVQLAGPRAWTAADAALIVAVADRSWDSIERARAEAALRRSEHLFRTVTEAHPVPVLIAQRGGIAAANPAFFDMLRMPDGDVAALQPGVWPGWDGHWTELAAFVRSHPRFDNHQTHLVRHGGERFPVAMSWRTARYQGARAAIVSLVDLTDMRRTQAELERSREALHQSEKLTALGSLLAGVSHELNNPLAVAMAQSALLEELLEDVDGAADLRARAGKVRSAAERCGRIVQTFLAMARQKEPVRRAVRAGEVAAAALELCGYGLRTAGIAVDTAFDPAAPPVRADPDQLHQVLMNLIVNAQHALQEVARARRLRLSVSREEGGVAIRVADNGPGVPAAIRRRVFEPFFTTKAHGAGTGIGLSFSLGMVEANGGTLELEETAEGASFRVLLPAAAAADDAPAASARPAARRGRALVVDDEPDLAEALAAFVGRLGFETDVAGGGRAARAMLEAGAYDLLLTDLRMPDMDGEALHGWLATARPALAERMIVVTGDTLGPAAERFIERARPVVVDKPFTADSVAAGVRAAMARGGTGGRE